VMVYMYLVSSYRPPLGAASRSGLARVVTVCLCGPWCGTQSCYTIATRCRPRAYVPAPPGVFELKLSGGVVVFSVGVNEGSPQAYPTDPLHACIVFQIHTRKGRAPVRRPLSASLSDEAHLSYMYAIACCCCRVPLSTPFLGVSQALRGPRVRNTSNHMCVSRLPPIFLYR
jgi:hypothetical protein